MRTALLLIIGLNCHAQIDTIVNIGGVKVFQNVRSSQLLTGTNAEQRNVFVGWQSGNEFLNGTQGYANTAVGWRSLWQAKSNIASEASSNTAIGYNSLDSLSTGAFNVGVGVLAGNGIKTTQFNSYIGYHCGLYQVGARNTALGAQAMAFQFGSANNSVAVGYRNQYYLSLGTDNCSSGYQGLYGNQTGSRNTSIGNYAVVGSVIANVSDNTGIGYTTQSLTTTNRNTSIGSYSLLMNTTNGWDVAIGYDAMRLNSSAGQATFIGYGSGDQATSGCSFCVGVGDRALRKSTGNSNIGIGSLVGNNTETGSSLILIGSGVNASSSTASNELNIGNGVYGVNLYNTANFRMGIGVSNPHSSAKLEVSSTTQGVLIPRMTTTQINSIYLPQIGLIVFNTTLEKVCIYTSLGWRQLSDSEM